MRNTGAVTFGMAVAFVFLWNSGFIGAEFGLPYAGPFTLLFWRYAALTIILLLYLLLSGRPLWPGLRAAGHASFVGILAHGVWLGCVLIALARGVPAGIVALVVALQPLTTGAFSGFVVGERTNLYQWLGLAVGFCGVAISVGARLDGDDTGSVFGYLIPFGSVVAITTASLLQRRQETTGRPPSLDVALYYQSFATTIALAPPALIVEGFATEWTPPFLATMAWLILAVSLGAYGLMWLLLRRIDATRVASLFYFGPPVTMVMAWIAFADVLWITDVIGLSVAAFGVLLVHVRRKASRSV